ncbi:hypothetical protein KCMC57_63870 (plasmid) [Kitasatospora sp. CMC57]|uniref:Uncharacterized protein n=1 Tax=Kitasatospora sp. CMC57 TaxID=3231513 RepID=A0AB33K967_9ACTN
MSTPDGTPPGPDSPAPAPDSGWPPPGTTTAPYPPLPGRGLTVDQAAPLTTRHVD